MLQIIAMLTKKVKYYLVKNINRIIQHELQAMCSIKVNEKILAKDFRLCACVCDRILENIHMGVFDIWNIFIDHSDL